MWVGDLRRRNVITKVVSHSGGAQNGPEPVAMRIKNRRREAVVLIGRAKTCFWTSGRSNFLFWGRLLTQQNLSHMPKADLEPTEVSYHAVLNFVSQPYYMWCDSDIYS